MDPLQEYRSRERPHRGCSASSEYILETYLVVQLLNDEENSSKKMDTSASLFSSRKILMIVTSTG